MPDGVELIAYADDVAILAHLSVTFKVGELLEEAADLVSDWLMELNIELAIQKSELIVFTRRRTHNTLEINLKGQVITSTTSVKYLGITLDPKLNFKSHAANVTKKAVAATDAIKRIMPNIGGPRQQTRKLLSLVPHSILLYGAAIWARNMSPGGRKILTSCQRKIALRVATAYRTTSTDALLVIAGTPPVDLLALMRAETEEERKGSNNPGRAKNEARIELEKRWQERWSNGEKGNWTRKLIPDLRPWVRRNHGGTSFHLTQALAGHGCFPAYLNRFGLLLSPACWFYGHHTDDAQHTLFECEMWHEKRRELETEIGEITPDNMVNRMLTSREMWRAVENYITWILKRKEDEERRRQKYD